VQETEGCKLQMSAENSMKEGISFVSKISASTLNFTLRRIEYPLTEFIVLTFVFPCIFIVITIDNQQDATILFYLLIINSTCFWRCFRPSSGAYHCNYSSWYCPPMLLLAGVAYTTNLHIIPRLSLHEPTLPLPHTL